MALVIWSLTSERRLLRSIACGPEKIFFYLAHLARQGYRSALPNTLKRGDTPYKEKERGSVLHRLPYAGQKGTLRAFIAPSQKSTILIGHLTFLVCLS